jgi:exopolyphosphatase/guanosine-5'-triphosphate,3'-diphosphate pyrophosphatase
VPAKSRVPTTKLVGGNGADAAGRSAKPNRVAAVIDIGTASVRMAIGEISEAGEVRPLTTLAQAVNLGRDTFMKGTLDRGTIEECVRVLKSYRRILAEYGVERPEQVRVVGTSAVREAQNRLAFLDRMYTATGFAVEPLDESEVNRITYLGIQPLLRADPVLADARVAVTEVGGGSTELLLVQNADVLFAHSYRLGSLRLRAQLESFHASPSAARAIMESQIKRVVEQIVQQLPHGGASAKWDEGIRAGVAGSVGFAEGPASGSAQHSGPSQSLRPGHPPPFEIRFPPAEGPSELIAIGGDMRFAARQLIPDWQPDDLARLPLESLERLTNEVLSLNEDKLVHRYHVTFPDAGTLGAALLAYIHLARAFRLDRLIVSNVNLRDGLLQDMARRGGWSEDFSNQVLRSAVELGRKFDFDEPHARHVAKLCQILFQGLRDEHQLDPKYELLLCVAALLHEIGLYVGASGYHKHSMYLIQHSEVFGLSKRDEMLVALTARYHRRASPKPTHVGYTNLDRDARIAVVKMAALLRVADALDASHGQRLHELRFSREGGRLVISVPQVDDLSLEQLTLKQSGTLFEETYGMPVVLRRLRT